MYVGGLWVGIGYEDKLSLGLNAATENVRKFNRNVAGSRKTLDEFEFGTKRTASELRQLGWGIAALGGSIIGGTTLAKEFGFSLGALEKPIQLASLALITVGGSMNFLSGASRAAAAALHGTVVPALGAVIKMATATTATLAITTAGLSLLAVGAYIVVSNLMKSKSALDETSRAATAFNFELYALNITSTRYNRQLADIERSLKRTQFEYSRLKDSLDDVSSAYQTALSLQERLLGIGEDIEDQERAYQRALLDRKTAEKDMNDLLREKQILLGGYNIAGQIAAELGISQAEVYRQLDEAIADVNNRIAYQKLTMADATDTVDDYNKSLKELKAEKVALPESLKEAIGRLGVYLNFTPEQLAKMSTEEVLATAKEQLSSGLLQLQSIEKTALGLQETKMAIEEKATDITDRIDLIKTDTGKMVTSLEGIQSNTARGPLAGSVQDFLNLLPKGAPGAGGVHGITPIKETPFEEAGILPTAGQVPVKINLREGLTLPTAPGTPPSGGLPIIGGLLDWLGGFIGLAEGGKVKKTGLAIVDQGEVITPAGQSGGFNVTIEHVTLTEGYGFPALMRDIDAETRMRRIRRGI